MQQYFKSGDVSIRVSRIINHTVDRHQETAEERSKGNGVGTLIDRFAEGIEVVAAATGRTHDNRRDSFSLSIRLARSCRKQE